MDLPEHFKDGDDAHEDVTAPKGKNAAQYMHQSIFSMITAAGGGPQVNYQSRFDEDPSEGEEDAEHAGHEAQTSDGAQENQTSSPSASSSRRRSRLFRSIPRLHKIRRPKDSREPSTDPMSSSQILPPRKQWQEHSEDEEDAAKGSNEAPILSRMLTARAELEEAHPESPLNKSRFKSEVDVGAHSVTSSVSLAQRLKEIFDFDEPEEVITEYPCWLLQTVLLQGYMYITQKHICFYAYLPKKEVSLSKSANRRMLTVQRLSCPNPGT